MQRRKTYRILRPEVLEARLNMAYLVDLATDEDDGNFAAGDLSLREAIGLANADPAEDTISFAPGITTIPLTVGELVLTDAAKTTVNGGGVIVDGGNSFGVFAVNNGATAELYDLTIRNGNGGFSSAGGIDNQGTLTITNSTLSGNTASIGGGIDNGITGTLTVTNSTLSGNSASFGGGGISNYGTLSVTNSTLSGNSSGIGGGGILNGGTLTVTNSTVAGNSARYFGGGIYNQAGPVTIIQSTLTNNRADLNDNGSGSGGGIWTVNDDQTFTTLQNTIVAGNFIGMGTTPSDLAEKNVEAASTNNLIGDTNTAGGLTNNTNGNKVGFAVEDVLNTTFTNNGGPTLTHALVPGSPAIDAGLNTNATGLTTDQRGSGFPRLVGTVDIGAVESNFPLNLLVDLALDEDDSDYSTGDLSLREAIRLANENSVAATITFAAGITTVSLTIDQLFLFNSAITTINGGGVIVERERTAGDFRIFNIDVNAIVEINELTIRNGIVSGGGGGGIYNAGTLTVSNSTVSGNSVNFGNNGGAIGGGIKNTGTLTVTNSTLSGNTADGGGGIFNEGGMLTVTDSTLSGNSASFIGGIANTGTLIIINSTLSGNSGNFAAGGIFNDFGTLTVTNSTLSGNSANDGAGIFNTGTLTVTNSTFSENTASNDGGGLYNVGILTVTNSTLSGNSANKNGGGIFNRGILTITNSTLSGNAASNDGGGIYIGDEALNGDQTLLVLNSTLTNNRADSDGDGFGTGGGVLTLNDGQSFTTLQNTIVAGNFVRMGTTANDLAEKNVEATSTNNLIGDASSAGGLTNGTNGNLVGISVASVLNPTLESNGGPTLTHSLVANSPAINAGLNDNATGLMTDQRGAGFARVNNGTVDIGAVEATSAPLTINLVLNLTTPSSNQPITITVNLTGAPIPTGTVTLVVNGIPGTAVPLVFGQAQVTLNGLPVGLHTIFARYSGDANYATVDSAVLNQQVYSPSDLNRSNAVDITDVLISVFYFNTYANQLPIAVANLPAGPPFVDASGDGQFDIRDLLRVVFDYNQSLANPEGEAAADPLLSLAPTLSPATEAVFSNDIDWLWPELLSPKRRRSLA